ncbi:hypothetical protein LK996_06995 [Lysobacter sp. A6]|uniref:Uncharacterized protein n=1 Tax=Noviluteimonas lactosilytica TaxID=2888523 RepID=A0ABS8JGY0_9GAMM|nr:hypothetical protein [Lysobacter lactosilyticus]MCC8362822.1 hypothetical protein [Lysobacter lactosilyticus]
MLNRRALAVALLCALPVLPAFAEEAAPAPTVKWVIPWKAGMELKYATESNEVEVRDGKRQHERTRSNDTMRLTQATADGFQQTWTSADPQFDVLEGDKAMEGLARETFAKVGDLEVVVALDKDGNYARIENIDALSKFMREAMRPLASQGLAKQGDMNESDRQEAAEMVDGILDRMTQPAVVEAMIGRDLQWYNGFVGIDIEPDTDYGVETELPNPMGGPAFPAKLTFSLSVSEDDPDDLFVAFEQTIDPVKGAKALAAMAATLVGEEHKDGLDDVIKSIEVKDEGLFVVHRPTGVIEMFETTRTTKVAGRDKVERNRMRLTNGDHAHEWVDEQEGTEAEAKAEAKAEGDA